MLLLYAATPAMLAILCCRHDMRCHLRYYAAAAASKMLLADADEALLRRLRRCFR